MNAEHGNLGTAGSNQTRTYSPNIEKSPKIGILSRVRQSIGVTWRRANRQNESSDRLDIKTSLTKPVRGSGWLSYFTQRTTRKRSIARRDSFVSSQGKKTRRKIRRAYVSHDSATENKEYTKDFRPAARFLAFRRSISLPSDDIVRQQFNLKRSMSTREGLGLNSMNRTSDISQTLEEKIAEQTKDFCRDYIVQKLKRNNLIQRVKIDRPAGSDHLLMREVYTLCYELERRSPNTCRNLSRQLGITLRSEEVLRKAFFEFCREILMTDVRPEKKSSIGPCQSNTVRDEEQNNKVHQITWGRILALFVVAGAFSIDCVKQGHSELVSELIEICGDFFLEEGIVDWISSKNGWEKMIEISYAKTRTIDTTNAWNVFLVTVCVFASLALGVGISNLTVEGV